MTRIAAVLVALAAALFTAPAALAVTFDVNDPGEATDAGALNACLTDTAGCTLPAAITDSNASAGVADTIVFSGAGTAPGPFSGALPQITDPVVIDGGGATTVTFAGTAAGPLVDVVAANTTLKAITIRGGGSGVAVNFTGTGDRLDTVVVRDTPTTAVRLGGSSERVDGSTVASAGSTGILIAGPSATVASTIVSAAAGRGIDVTGASASISAPTITGSGSAGIVLGGSGTGVTGGSIHGNTGDGVMIGGQGNSVSRVVLYANAGKPIANAPGANGGISPPQNLRIGPRRADGSLPLTGTGSGTVELWSGDPSSSSAPAFFTTFSAAGDFTYNFPGEPAPGSVFAASITGGSGSSEFATVAVPSDVSSPNASFARAIDTVSVRVDFSEPLDPASVQQEDFKLSMAGADRAITGLAVDPSGTFVTLTSSGWRAGEAGYLDVTAVGALNDAVGNAMLSAPRLRVAAAPGDFVAPLGARLAVTPKTICLTRGTRCRKPGMVIKFVSTEVGKARLVIKRSNKTVGSRLYSGIKAGPNTLKFNGRLGSRKLRAGRYRLLMFIQDQVGNITDQPPITLFSVRRVSK